MKASLATKLIAVALAVGIGGLSLRAVSGPNHAPATVRGTQAEMPGPNLIADSSFESMETRAFTLDPPFKITADPHAHSGNADVHAELSHSGKRIFTRVSVWKSTDFVSKIWIRGSGAESGNTGNFNAVVYPPAGTDYTQWHTYGQLWIPATADNGWHGYRQVYFDGVPQQAICWIGNQTSETSQPSGSYLFSMCDGTPKSPPVVA